MNPETGGLISSVRLGDVCTFDPSKSEVRHAFEAVSPVTFASMSDLAEYDRKFAPSSTRSFSDVYRGYTYFANGDLLLAKITPCFENGKLGVANRLVSGVGFGSSEFMVLRPSQRLSPEYLFYFLSRDEFRKAGRDAMTGAVGHKRVPKEWVQSQRIPLPPLTEQEQIVAFLNEAFEAIAVATKKTASMAEAAPAIVAGEIDSLLASADASWSNCTLGEVCDVLDSRRKPVTKKDRASGPYPYYGATGVQDHVAEYLFDEPLVLLGEDGAKWGARERSAFPISGRTWVNNHAHVLRPDRKRLMDEWLILVLNAADLSEYITGVTVPKLNQARMRDIPILLPSLAAQRSLLQRIEGIRAEVNQAVDGYFRKLTLLSELKQSLLARAFFGDLAARQAPSTAPAANDNIFATTEQVANIIAFAQRRHEVRGRGQTFGRVKAQKNLHLVESVGKLDLGRRPKKDAAGPNDFPHMLAAEDWSKAKGFFEFKARRGGGYDFKKLSSYPEMMAKADAALAPMREQIERATDLIVELDSEGAEVLATVHAAWNNLILDGLQPSEDVIVHEARDEWHADKLKIPEAKFRQAIQSIRRLGIVPDGTAKRVGEPKLL